MAVVMVIDDGDDDRDDGDDDSDDGDDDNDYVFFPWEKSKDQSDKVTFQSNNRFTAAWLVCPCGGDRTMMSTSLHKAF